MFAYIFYLLMMESVQRAVMGGAIDAGRTVEPTHDRSYPGVPAPASTQLKDTGLSPIYCPLLSIFYPCLVH